MQKNIKRKKNKKKSNRIAKLSLMIAVIGIVIYTVIKVMQLIIAPTDMFIVGNGSVSCQESAVGYVIRDETIVKGNNYENGMFQIKSEGEKVSKGDEIFRYYSNNENELNSKILEINTKIQEALEGQTNWFPSDVKAIEDQIENRINGLKYKNDIQEILEYKNDINTYITKKSKIAGELSQSGSYINQLLNEKQQYENELYSNSEHIKASESGVVSYRVDNLETVLTPDNFDSLNKDFLEGLNLNTGQIVTTSNQMGKIINNYECYIATVINSEEAKNIQLGKNIKLKLSSTQDIVTSEVSHISKQEDGEILIVLKINYGVESLIDYRKISFDILWWEHEGLKIPETAIIYDNGLSYVVRNRAGYFDKILIKIEYKDQKYCIVDNYLSEDLSELGYSTSEINKMGKINLYDQILNNPKLEDL